MRPESRGTGREPDPHDPAAARSKIGASVHPFLDAAAGYISLGLCPVPVIPGTKRPADDWRELQGRRPADEDWSAWDLFLSKWWSGAQPYDIAILTGGEVYVSETETAYLVVLDSDSDDAIDFMTEVANGRPGPVVITGSGGRHHYFVADEPIRNRVRIGGHHLDVRGRGGLVVVPPSRAGAGYRWEISPAWNWDDPSASSWPPPPVPSGLAELVRSKRPDFPSEPPDVQATDRYAEAALLAELENVRTAPIGTRNDALNRAVWKVWRFVAAGQLGDRQVVREFAGAARACGLSDAEAAATISSAIGGRSRLDDRDELEIASWRRVG